MNSLPPTPPASERATMRCVTLRILFGLSFFAATGAGAGTAGAAHAAATPQAPAAVVVSAH